MKNKVYILVVITLLAVLGCSPVLAGDSGHGRERKIKAEFLYNFINFVQWPKEKMPDNDEPIIIGVVGLDSLSEAFDPIGRKKIKCKKIVIKHFDNFCNTTKKLKGRKSKDKWNLAMESLKKCHVVFISDCKFISKDETSVIVDALKGTSVLTVGEKEGFLESGGNINFLVGKKVQFEVNLVSAKRNSLEIRSKLLKLAKRVIKEEKSKDSKE